MLSPTSSSTAGVAGCKECAAAAACSSSCTAPVTIERERDWLWIRTKMPVCIWPETCLLGCAALEHHLGSKLPMLQPPLGVMVGSSFDTPFTSPPPAHMGIPPVTIDPKTGLPRHVYPYPSPSGQLHPSLYPDVQWQRPPGYPISSGALGGHYAPPLLNSSARFPPGFLPPGIPHPGLPHPFGPGPKQEVSQDSHRHGFHDGQSPDVPEKKKQPHIKKPLNAFMLFMKEQRAKVVAECTLKESAAINQILGRRWHSLDRSEQAKYYEMARKEKELHLQLYPGWSARDNYATHNKKKKRKRELGPGEKGMTPEDRYLDNPAFGDCTQSKKCRARFGMDQQKHWCKPCRSFNEQSCDQISDIKMSHSDSEEEEKMH